MILALRMSAVFWTKVLKVEALCDSHELDLGISTSIAQG